MGRDLAKGRSRPVIPSPVSYPSNKRGVYACQTEHVPRRRNSASFMPAPPRPCIYVNPCTCGLPHVCSLPASLNVNPVGAIQGVWPRRPYFPVQRLCACGFGERVLRSSSRVHFRPALWGWAQPAPARARCVPVPRALMIID